MNKIPCIKNKCLMYPLCINKEKIECNDIAKYHDYLRKEHKCAYSECFKEIKKTLKVMDEYATTYPLPKGWNPG
jgi:hypothetical protein